VPSTSTTSLTGRSFLRELDFAPAEWSSLVDLARALKTERAGGREIQRLVGRTIALIFEKTSTRTRCAFEVAAYHQGAHVTVLDPAGSQIGHKESVADTARVLGRFFDGIEYRGAAQETVETMARYAGVPVWNGLTDEWHPTQGLCDSLTMLEHARKAAEDIAFAYVGDSRNNMANSLLAVGALLGMDVRIVAPSSLQPAPEVLNAARHVAAETGARLSVTDDLTGVEGVDFVHTDVWVSMGEPKAVWAERIELLMPYQVNARLMERTGNPGARLMHCLPAYHDLGTSTGREIHAEFGLSGLEVTDEVFEGPASIVFDQAENRMHSIKAVLVATLAG
jgi:ornithine carbamoyltransferase